MIPQIGPLDQLIASILQSLIPAGGGAPGGGMSVQTPPPSPQGPTASLASLQQWMQQSRASLEQPAAVPHYRQPPKEFTLREEDQDTTRRTRP